VCRAGARWFSGSLRLHSELAAGAGAFELRPTDRAGVATCHNGFPELTPSGSQFKLNGYAWTGGTSNLPPIAAMAIPTFTKCGKVWKAGWRRALDSTMTPLSKEASFYGAKIFDGLGGLAQVTYDNVPNRSVGTTRHPVRHTI
jgi:hypothetical protein